MTTLRDDLAEALREGNYDHLVTADFRCRELMPTDGTCNCRPKLADAILATDAGKRLQARLDAAMAAQEVVEAARAVSNTLRRESIDISGLASQYPAVYEVGKSIVALREAIARYDSIPAAGEEAP